MPSLAESADLRLDRLEAVREALRHDDLRQALYDASPFMTDALINLHGDMHRRRRRAEQPLFSREALAAREQTLLEIGAATLAPHVRAGGVELVQFGREVSANVAVRIAGIDVDMGEPQQTTELVRLVTAFSEIATVANSTRDPEAVRRDAEAAWKLYRDRYLEPSIARRRRAQESGEQLHDIIATMLRQPEITEDVLHHEATLYMTATVGTAPGVLISTFEELRKRWAERPELRQAESADVRFLQRAAWEAIRLYPANPQHLRRAHRKVVLGSGQEIDKDQLVYLDVIAANRDRAIFGPSADVFDPNRTVPAGAAPWGIGFGAGIHVCMGQNLAGGTDSLVGMLALLLSVLYRHQPEIDPADPPQVAESTTRRTWARYPVRLVE